MTILLPPFQFGCLLFLFLVWSLRLKLLILCWIKVVKADILVLFLILGGKLLVLAHWVYVDCRSLIYGVYFVEECSLYSHCAEHFYDKWVLYLIKSLFSIYWHDHVTFVFHYVYVHPRDVHLNVLVVLIQGEYLGAGCMTLQISVAFFSKQGSSGSVVLF